MHSLDLQHRSRSPVYEGGGGVGRLLWCTKVEQLTSVPRRGGARKAYIDGDEFKKAILGHYRDYHLVAGIAIVIEEGEAPCVGLHEKGGGLIE